MQTNLDETIVKNAQFDFYVAGKAGCAFAALAAKTPARYGWKQVVLPVNARRIQSATHEAICDQNVSTISLIFPSVKDTKNLRLLIAAFEDSDNFFFDPEIEYEGFRCVGLRVRVGKFISWVSGFG